MFQKLHIQMTIFSAIITGGLLALMTLACLMISEKGIRERDFASFTGNAISCLSYLEGQESLSLTWKAQVLENHHIQMELWDNGRRLFQEKSFGEEKHSPAFMEAARISREEEGLDVENLGAVSKRREAIFQMEGYYACTALIPRKGGMVAGILLYDLREQREIILRQRMAFGVLASFVLVALFVFSWFFTGHLIQPLKESRKKQTEFIAAASHELRSPLAVILSSVQAMEGAREQEKEIFLSNIKRESQRMARLVQDLLSLANADNHSWQLCLKKQELDTILLLEAEAFEPVMKEKGIRLLVELPKEEVDVCVCDGARITQVLSILLDNGASYVQKGGQICLKLTEEKDHFMVQVKDNGPGIPKEEQKDIFQRFYRTDKARRDKQHFGLGLSIAREIAVLHEGSLTVRDTPGGGATFILTLPKKKI